MQTPSASDPSFKAFLDSLKEQNNREFATQVLQLKTEREIAGEDDDKREQQLDQAIVNLDEVRKAVTGISIEIDISPLVTIGENQTQLLSELSKEASLTRKLTEGSVEYDKEAAQYRNTSGREIESLVSGKMSKKGGFIDFETARDTLSGQSKRVQESNKINLKSVDYVPGTNISKKTAGVSTDTGKVETSSKSLMDEIKDGLKFWITDGMSEQAGTGWFQKPSKEVTKKDREAKVSSTRQVNPEADNIQSTGEVQNETAKSDLEISKQLLETTKASLTELQAIRQALAPSTPKDLPEQKSTPATVEAAAPESGGSVIGDIASAAGSLLGRGGKGKPGKGLGGRILGGVGKAARFLGPAAAVAGAAYSGVEGYQNTNQNFDLEEGQEATTGQKVSSTLGGVASGLTFGLLDEKTAAQGIHKAGEAIGETASKAGSYISEKASGIGSSVAGFFGFGDKSKDVKPITGVSTEQAAAARSNFASVDPRRVDTGKGQTVAETSTENRDMERESSKGGGNNTIVSNNVSSNETTKFVPVAGSPRPEFTGSALDRYQSRIAVY